MYVCIVLYAFLSFFFLFNSGVRNTFWSALLYFIFSGRAFGVFLPDPLRFWLANAGVCVPLLYDAIFNLGFGTKTCVLGFIEAPIGALISYYQDFRDKMNEEYHKKHEDKPVEEEEKSAEEKKDQ